MSKVLKNVFINLFADDTLLNVFGDDLALMVEEMNSDLKRLSDWLAINKLKLNVSKTK